MDKKERVHHPLHYNKGIEMWDYAHSNNLDFFDQTQWRTNYFGLSPEKFKNVIWES